MMDVGDDVRVLRTPLHGLVPFPTWNSTVAAPSTYCSSTGRCSLLCENGDVVVVQATQQEQLDAAHSRHEDAGAHMYAIMYMP